MEKLEDLPTKVRGWKVDYSLNTYNRLEAWDQSGARPKSGTLPIAHHLVKVYTGTRLNMVIAPTSYGVWTTASNIAFRQVPVVQVLEDGNQSGRKLQGLTFEPINPPDLVLTWGPGALIDARSVPDFKTLRAEQDLKQATIDIEEKAAKDEAVKLEEEIAKLNDPPSEQKLSELISKIKITSVLLYPDTDLPTTDDQVRAIKNYTFVTPEILPAIKKIIPEAVDETTGELDIEKKLEELERAAARDRTAGDDLKQLQAEYDQLKSQYPSVGGNGVIKYGTMEDVRRQLVELYGRADDFSSELQLIGFLSDKVNERSKLLEEEQNARKNQEDPYADTRKDLLLQISKIREQLSAFKCDTSELDRQIAEQLALSSKREAAEAYNRNKGFIGKTDVHKSCTPNGLLRWKLRY